MQRLATEARELKADGLLGVDFTLEERGRGRIPGAVSVHVLASAVRRTGRRCLHPDAIATGAAR
jgi:uncharacterized protein YbjQ (UPF0145 family)